jgi:hypothetical protein
MVLARPLASPRAAERESYPDLGRAASRFGGGRAVRGWAYNEQTLRAERGRAPDPGSPRALAHP